MGVRTAPDVMQKMNFLHAWQRQFGCFVVEAFDAGSCFRLPCERPKGEDGTMLSFSGKQRLALAICIPVVMLLAGKALSADTDEILIERIKPAQGGGHAYRLTYHVNLPIRTFWKFKTDFDNTFVVENKFIRAHRFVMRSGDMVITEDKYTYGPDVFFRWRTTLATKHFRLDFVLLNPEECNQAYHYGHIQLEPDGAGTRVIQVAYFDFFGAAVWAYYPWAGGMKALLMYTARWEQATAKRLETRYHAMERGNE